MRLLVAAAVLSVINGLRTLCFWRSDETWTDRLVLVLIRPLAALWSSIVLSRAVRLYGTLTLLRQEWTTRQRGPEIVFRPQAEQAAVPAEAA